MNFIPQIIFVLLLGVASFLIAKRISRISSNIKLGRSIDRSDQPGRRLKTLLLVAFGQKKMFKRPIPALLHFIIYAGFVLINIEVLEIVIDGLTGTHRIFASLLPIGFYKFLINFFEFLAVGVLLSCVVFLIRRNVLRLPRFKKPEMKGWPALDANLILIIEIVLMLAILTMNAADTILQTRDFEHNHYIQTGPFFFSQLLIPVLEGHNISALIVVERVAWWFHIIGIMAFALYVTYSKHLHIFLSFPNTYFSNLEPKGEFNNMDAVTTEVKLAMGLIQDEGEPSEEMPKFGASDINHLTWKNLMDAYSCTECGRCTAECPANLTGKKLSPRRIMMATRDRVEEVGQYIEKNKTVEEALSTGEILYSETYISKEELMACTTCNACVEACPINIDPLSIIMQMRQHIFMEESDAPQSWNMMSTNIENNLAPWQFPPTDRANWVSDVKN